MIEVSIQALPGSRILFREVDGELLLHLPARPRRWLKQIAQGTLFGAGFLTFVYLVGEQEPPLFAMIFLGTFLATLLCVGFALVAGPYLMKTFVLVTAETLVLKTVLFGKESIQQYGLSETSRAKQHWVDDEDGGYMLGIDVETQNGEAHFGDGLSEGELDWVEWRINRFLGQTEADAPQSRLDQGAAIEGVPAAPVPRRAATKVRIAERVEEQWSETRIHFPNTVETRTFSGLGIALFGLGLSSYCVFVIVHEWDRLHARESLIMSGVFALTGLLFLLSGLSRLFGRSRLTINPEYITYHASLFGIPLRLTLPTAEVISVGSRAPQEPTWRGIAPAKGCVIRTAERELDYGDAVPSADAPWVVSEVGRRIQTARGSV